MRSGHERGMTLIEILVVVAIIGAMAALGASALRSIFELDLEHAAQGISSTIRYAYGEAIRHNEIYRLVLNLDQGRYSLESAPNTADTLLAIATEGNDEEEDDVSALDSREPDSTSEDRPADDEEPRPVGFEPIASTAVKARSISPARFASVFTSHDPKAVEEGLAYLYFFPNGSAEYAIINLSDEEGETTYSIEVNPLTGETTLRSEAREPNGE